MKVNLFDFNNLAIRTFLVKNVNAITDDPDLPLWKFYLIESIYKSLYRSPADEVILAVDAKDPWRKSYWSRYKEHRKKRREESPIRWGIFFREYDKLCDEIIEHLPFKVIRVSGSEADDIIAVIATEYKEKIFTIISNDEDFLQLSGHANIKIYNPSKMDYVRTDNVPEFLLEKFFFGQKKDGIFNVKTPLDWPLDRRKPSFGEALFQKIKRSGYVEWLKDNGLEERFHTNRVLIDFDRIPRVIRSRIIKEYSEYKMPDPNKMKIFFEKNGLQSYLDNFHNVENRLAPLFGG